MDFILLATIELMALEISAFWQADTCLDSGGRFNYEQAKCDY